SASHRDRASGQVSLFDDLSAPFSNPVARNIVAWTEQERMAFEKELLGFYVTGHPLDAYATVIAAGSYQSIGSLNDLADRATFRVAGVIAQVDKKFTKKEGKPFAVVFVEDLSGLLEIVIWNEVYVKVSDALLPARVIAVQGTLDKRDDAMRATAQKVKPLVARSPSGNPPSETLRVREEPVAPLVLRLPQGTCADDLRRIRDLLSNSPGDRHVVLEFERANGAPLRIAAGRDCYVGLTPELEQKLAPWLSSVSENRAALITVS
ncbi:MAG TPA: OB-fold nucleic acid binding domain-containing protein, partial [Chthoniobacterales bacterium]|nr:OB-fold nucleic acid binding domain-containing protein [Chthoniobacterales bacterium]